MFSLLRGVYDSYLAPTQLNVLVIGPPGVGKTALLERLKVTNIPKRPQSNHGTLLPNQNTSEPLTPALYEAFRVGETTMTTVPGATMAVSSSSSSSPVASAEMQKKILTGKINPHTPTPKVVQKRSRFKLSICPAPERYSRSSQDQEEDFIEDDTPTNTSSTVASTSTSTSASASAPTSALDTSNTTERPKHVRTHSKEFNVSELDLLNSERSMEDIPLHQPRSTTTSSKEAIPSHSTTSTNKSMNTKTKTKMNTLRQPSGDEVDMKPNTKMLPLSKIRPTIGSNLAKIDMFGTKCHFFDVGGKLQSLWERYYEDCDAVIFCWKLNSGGGGDDDDENEDGTTMNEKDSNVDNDNNDNNNNNNEEEEDSFDMTKQIEVLNQVRKAISDDVPFLIFGQVFGNINTNLVDKMYTTDIVLPHYHNNLTGLCCGSSKTGAGVQYAMEWVIPLAKRQQKERLAMRKTVEEKQV